MTKFSAEKEFEKLDQARKLLELNEEAYFEEIKNQFHKIVKKFHPDTNKNNSDSHLKTIEIMQAYELIIKYFQNYKISFKKEDFNSNLPQIFNSSSSEYYNWWHNNYHEGRTWF